MTDENPQKTIRVVVFSGKEEDWNRWSKTFLAMETARGLREVIKPDEPEELQELKDNDRVYSDLMLACQEDVVFGIVDDSVTEAYPDGDAREAWKRLNDRFEPKGESSKVQLKSDFQKMKLVDPDEDPDVWINSLELMRRRLKNVEVKISDEDFMLHILNNIPQKHYETTIEICEVEITASKLTLTTLKERLRLKY